MVRLARVRIPYLPHHKPAWQSAGAGVHRGRRLRHLPRTDLGGGEAGWNLDLVLLPEAPNHVHFIMVLSRPDGLRDTFAEAHRRYTARIHQRFKWTGHLWQGRFGSVAMDDAHMLAAARCVPINPVCAGIVATRGLALVERAGAPRESR